MMLPLVLFLLVGLGGAHVSPECHMKPWELAARYGYNCERHWATTPDGYILEMHRIPGKEGAPAVFLQHGLLDSSATWLLNGKKDSFAFILSDAGYDVWLGNVRGNTYTKNHTTLPVNSDEFWAFSFDEMAKYDLPTMIDYATDHSGQEQIFYYGHSQGTIIAFTGFPLNKTLSSKIKLFTALAPVGRVTHVKGFFAVLTQFQSQLEWFFKSFGFRQFLPSNWLIQAFATIVCPLQEALCSDFIFIMSGFDRSNFNESRVEIYEAHTPAGTSVKNIIHWSQMIHAKKLQMYDYENEADNIKNYGTPTPPVYNVSGLDIPTFFVTGGNDWLGDPRDVLWLYQEMGHNILDSIDIDYYNHLDFLWGIDAWEMVYNPMVKVMNSML